MGIHVLYVLIGAIFVNGILGRPGQHFFCLPGSPKNCKATYIPAKGYSAGGLIKINGGFKVSKITQQDSCPSGWKIWSPRNKKDWTIVFNLMGKNIANYPHKPHLLIDVTRSAKGCGGCTKFAMKSGVKEQSSWRTSDGSAWWMRDTKYNEPNGDYQANCFLHVYDVNPNNVRFNDGNCNYASTDYLCQPATHGGLTYHRDTTVVPRTRVTSRPRRTRPHSSGSTFCQRYATTCGTISAWSHCAKDFAHLNGGKGNKGADTQACRLYHLGMAENSAGDAKIHCPHASKTGGGVCVDPKCLNGSPKSCKIQRIAVKNYSPGGLIRVINGLKVSKISELNSCPVGWKIWSPRNKADWTAVYNAFGHNIHNYPRKPALIIDVTHSTKGCGGCAHYVMNSGVKQQSSWRTSDGSAWWLRDTKFNEPSGDYTPNCYMAVFSVDPNDVRFNDHSCAYSSSEYLCQPRKPPPPRPGLPCFPGSPNDCVAHWVRAAKYSAGGLMKVYNGLRVKKSTEQSSCPVGWKIWSPRNKADWTAVYNAFGHNINNYPRKPHLLVDVTRPAKGCGGCTKFAMKSGVKQQSSWRTEDGSAWWLRDTKYNEPNGDYQANCYLHVYDVDPNNVRFNDGNCNYFSSDYLCQPEDFFGNGGDDPVVVHGRKLDAGS